LATVKAEIDANDPKVLRAEISQLKADLAKKPAATAPIDAAEMERKARLRGVIEGYAEALKDVNGILLDVNTLMSRMRQILEGFEDSARRIQASADRIEEKKAEFQSGSPTDRSVLPPTRAQVAPLVARSPSPTARGDGMGQSSGLSIRWPHGRHGDSTSPAIRRSHGWPAIRRRRARTPILAAR
jgi:hypothetical protein